MRLRRRIYGRWLVPLVPGRMVKLEIKSEAFALPGPRQFLTRLTGDGESREVQWLTPSGTVWLQVYRAGPVAGVRLWTKPEWTRGLLQESKRLALDILADAPEVWGRGNGLVEEYRTAPGREPRSGFLGADVWMPVKSHPTVATVEREKLRVSSMTVVGSWTRTLPASPSE